MSKINLVKWNPKDPTNNCLDVAIITDNRLKVLNKKPMRASPQEIELNPRSKSAKLRISAKKFLK